MSGLQEFLTPFSHLIFANRDKVIVLLAALLAWFTIQLLITRWRNERLERDLSAAKSGGSGGGGRRRGRNPARPRSTSRNQRLPWVRLKRHHHPGPACMGRPRRSDNLHTRRPPAALPCRLRPSPNPVRTCRAEYQSSAIHPRSSPRVVSRLPRTAGVEENRNVADSISTCWRTWRKWSSRRLSRRLLPDGLLRLKRPAVRSRHP